MNEASREGVRAVLVAENLGGFNRFEARRPRAGEVGIVVQGAGWRVYSTDERAYEEYEKVHGDEGEALADFLMKVRATNRYLARRGDRLNREKNSAEA
jgi:hypothetical protein